MDDGLGVGPGEAADLAHRQPVLPEVDRLLRIQEGIGLLVPEQAGLYLDLRAAVVRERAPPVQPLRVGAPAPDLLGGKLGDIRIMHDTRARAGMVDAHERLTRAVAEERHRALQVIPGPAEVDPLPVHGPRIDLGEAVGGRELHRIDEPRVVPDLDGGVRPPVEPVAHVAAVVERRGLLQHRAPRVKRQLHSPLHPVDEVHVPHHDGGAAVGPPHQRVIDGGRRHPVVRDREVELDAEGGPGPAVGHLRELQRGVRVEHLRPVGLVDAAPEPAPEVGQHRDAQVLVLQVERAPGAGRPPPREAFPQGVRVVEAPAAEQVEGRVDVRRAFFVGGDDLAGLPRADRARPRARVRCGQRDRGRRHRHRG